MDSWNDVVSRDEVYEMDGPFLPIESMGENEVTHKGRSKCDAFWRSEVCV